MKPWFKKTLWGVFGASIALGGLTACSHGPHGHGPMGAEKMAEVRDKMVQRVSHKLDLNDAQKLKLNALADTLQAQRTALRDSTGDPRVLMQSFVAGAQFDRAGAQALVDEKARAIQAASPQVIAALADFYDSLDATQQQKVREFMQQRRGWMSRG
jgi:periplasmic protein CpxP/Spy